MTDALKPCPWCKGPATRLDGHYDFGGEWFETGCDNVGCRVLPSVKTLSREHADDAWNTRTDPMADPRVVALVELIAYAQQIVDPCYPASHADWQNKARAALSALRTGGDT